MDIKKMCRICLNSKNSLVDLFSGPDSVRLSYKIMDLTNVKIFPNDGLPSSICASCNQKLVECIEFVNLCKKSDSELRNKTIGYTVEDTTTVLKDKVDELKIKCKVDNKESSKADKVHSKTNTVVENCSRNIIKCEQKRTSQKQQCFTCGKVMSSRFRLKTHIATHLKEKQHSCTYCMKKFTILENLNTHLRTHTGEKPYSCVTCGKTFAQSSGLIVHKRKHTGQMPYQCEFCPRGFRTIGSYKYHVRVHTGERNYVCNTCGRAFITNSDLKQHKTTHSGEKPHICCICGTRFSRVANLKRHVTCFHNKEKSFKCVYCHSGFHRRVELNKHECCKNK